MAFSDGSWAWLSEAQGRFHYMGQAAAAAAARLRRHRGPARPSTSGRRGRSWWPRCGRARFATAARRAAVRRRAGQRAALRRPLRPRAASSPRIDYGTGDAAEALYVGTRGDARRSSASPTCRTAEDRLQARRRRGPEVPAVRGPARGPRARPDPARRLPVLRLAARRHARPRGARGPRPARASARSSRSGRRAASAASSGRSSAPWSAASPSRASATRGASTSCTSRGRDSAGWWRRRATGRSWSRWPRATSATATGSRTTAARSSPHFQSGTATVDHVLGEFYWAVARGDKTETDDYVAPPADAVQGESRESEITWSLGTYTEPDEVWKAFALEGSPAGAAGRRAPPALAVAPDPKQVVPARAPGRGRARRPLPRVLRGGQQDDPPAGGRHSADGRARRAGSGHLRGADLRRPPSPTSR